MASSGPTSSSSPVGLGSPLAHKWRRFEALAGLGPNSATTTTLPSFPAGNDVASEDKDEELATIMSQLPALFSNLSSLDPPSSSSPVPMPTPGPPVQSMHNPATADLSACQQQSVDHLEAASQAVRLHVARKEQSDKSTSTSYARHIKAYVAWWDAYQASVVAEDPDKVAIPAFPITAAKATMFMEYTSTRPKVSTPFHCVKCHV